MQDCFEFKEDDVSLTPIWATLPSLPLECWNPNALGKIGSRLGTPIAMDSLTRTMERVSYARILVEVDASEPLVDHVEFVLPNGVRRKQPILYEFTPKFCTHCNRFGHLKESCKGSQPAPAANETAHAVPATAVKQPADQKKGQPSEWTEVKRKQHKLQQKQQQPDCTAAGMEEKGRQGPSKPKDDANVVGQNVHSRWSSLGTRSVIESSDSSDESESEASTQHFMPGTSSAGVTPIQPKSKQKLGKAPFT
ncbi:UNVERIFIED_CONTAM: hypothetical protein Slati_0193000 [Sesamum latifolium]|uniref:DUF4283 domain-containing protein n=1 Tax=Sesamum latifolium TaxID=2727402 RepID=A0AAW2YBE0_9LAMI